MFDKNIPCSNSPTEENLSLSLSLVAHIRKRKKNKRYNLPSLAG